MILWKLMVMELEGFLETGKDWIRKPVLCFNNQKVLKIEDLASNLG